MHFFNGIEEAAKLDNEIIGYLAKYPISNKLLIIQIGDNASSEKYINIKLELCEKFEIPCIYKKISAQENDKEISNRVEKLFSNEKVSGGIVQLPLPRKSLEKVINLIPANKDIDNLLGAKDAQFTSPIVRSLQHFLTVGKIKTSNLRVGVLGYGSLVGKPISDYLLQQGANVKVLDKEQGFEYKKGQKLDFDLLVLSSGVPKLVQGEDIISNCHVIDFGSSVVNNKTVGDLDINSKLDHLGLVSPSPGGMGPLVTRYLIMNFLGI